MRCQNAPDFFKMLAMQATRPPWCSHVAHGDSSSRAARTSRPRPRPRSRLHRNENGERNRERTLSLPARRIAIRRLRFEAAARDVGPLPSQSPRYLFTDREPRHAGQISGILATADDGYTTLGARVKLRFCPGCQRLLCEKQGLPRHFVGTVKL
jgi:hypothetical protein